MPELPEVETIRRGLQRALPGATILRVDVRLAKMVKMPLARFQRDITKTRIASVQRRAKILQFLLSNGKTLVIHLKMTGQLIWVPRHGKLFVGGHPIPRGVEDLPNKYSHVMFVTNRGTLYFNDQRQFGYVHLFDSRRLAEWMAERNLGPEPLAPSFTLKIFQDILRKHAKKKIKPMLLDQSVIAGIGNIYADEACWRARVMPTRRVRSLTPRETVGLYRGLIDVLQLSIQKKGTTADAYRMANGRPGGMMPFLHVYQRTGMSCHRCKTLIKKMTLAGRGTHYCPTCQQ